MTPGNDRLRRAKQFEAFQLLRLIECAQPSAARLGVNARPSSEPVRLAQDAELRFSSAQVTSYEPAAPNAPARLALDFGLLGPQGPMPLHFTEYVRSRSRHEDDRALECFLDVFHHRMSSLFYRAWAASQPVIGLDRTGEDRFAVYVASLCGAAHDGARERDRIDAIGPEAKWGAAGLLRDCRRHASGLAALLAGVLGVPVAIAPFVGQWLRLPERELTRLGASCRKALLGDGYVLGRRTWNRQQKFRVVLGPLDAAQNERLQPGTQGFRRVAAWVRLYAGAAFDFEVVLRLAPDAAQAMRLGSNARLARNTWVGSPSAGGAEPRLRFDGAKPLRDFRTTEQG